MIFDNHFDREYSGEFIYNTGSQGVRQILRNILTYNEMVDILNNPENVNLLNPELEKYKTTQFTLLGEDFTRPDEEKSFAEMLPNQLYQIIREISYKDWEQKKDLILNRLYYLAATKEIKEGDFLDLMRRILGREHSEIWRENSRVMRSPWDEGNMTILKKAIISRAVLDAVLKASASDFLDDDSLYTHYSHNTPLGENGEMDFGYEEKEESTSIFGAFTRAGKRRKVKKVKQKISVGDGINELAKENLNSDCLNVLVLIMDMYPQRIGPKMANLFQALGTSAKNLHGKMTSDDFGEGYDYYKSAIVVDIPFRAMRYHPGYFAKLLLESPLLPKTLRFLLFWA